MVASPWPAVIQIPHGCCSDPPYIWAPSRKSTSSRWPFSTIARAPRTPSSAGWKINFTVPWSCSLIWHNSFAVPKPTAICPSCPQACIYPACSDRKPSWAGKWSSSSHSLTGRASISNRNATVGPIPQCSIPITPVMPPPSGTPIRASALHTCWSVSTSSQPYRCNKSAILPDVRNSIQPGSGCRWKSRRSSDNSDAEASAYSVIFCQIRFFSVSSIIL